MADILLQQKGGHRKTPVPRIDMTPMVDLGFLLISFFMFTTTMARPKAMEVVVPARPVQQQSIPEESTVTIIPTGGHRAACYAGHFDNTRKPVFIAFEGAAGIRQYVLNQQREARQLPASYSSEAHRLHVLIKPADDCSYEEVVNVLDEMNILEVPYYTLLDLSLPEKGWLQKNR